jgi:hypothetical protein
MILLTAQRFVYTPTQLGNHLSVALLIISGVRSNNAAESIVLWVSRKVVESQVESWSCHTWIGGLGELRRICSNVAREERREFSENSQAGYAKFSIDEPPQAELTSKSSRPLDPFPIPTVDRKMKIAKHLAYCHCADGDEFTTRLPPSYKNMQL